MTLVFGLYDVRKANEAEPAHIRTVQTAVIAARFGQVGHRPKVCCGQARSEIVLPAAVGGVIRGSCHVEGSGLVVCMSDDLDRVGVEVVVGDSLG